MTNHPSPPLSPLQSELLKAFSMQTVDETDLREIRLMLSRYFARKASSMAAGVGRNLDAGTTGRVGKLSPKVLNPEQLKILLAT